MRDEDPSPEDIARFGDDADQTGYCPECGAQVWDATPSCPKCGAWIEGGVLRRPPAAEAFHKRAMLLGIIIILIAFIFVFAI
jgi:hypothetical protein